MAGGSGNTSLPLVRFSLNNRYTTTRDAASTGITTPGEAQATPTKILLAPNPQVGGQIIHYCLREMSSSRFVLLRGRGMPFSRAPKLDDMSLCASYASLMLSFVPGLRDVFVEALTQAGAQVSVLTGEPDAPFHGIDLSYSFPPASNLLYFGESVLLLLKSIPEDYYYKFMLNQVHAMRSFIGVSYGDSEFVSMLCPDEASMIRTVLGSHHKLKKELMKSIIGGSRVENSSGKLCGYLCKMLEWTDMEYIKDIVEALVIPKSPVLNELRVSHEVRNFAMVLNEINSHEDPQYLRIMEPSTGTLERSNFPTLIEVAKRVKITHDPDRVEFESSSTQIRTSYRLVDVLVDKHKKYMRTSIADRLPSIITTFNGTQFGRD